MTARMFVRRTPSFILAPRDAITGESGLRAGLWRLRHQEYTDEEAVQRADDEGLELQVDQVRIVALNWLSKASIMSCAAPTPSFDIATSI